MQLRLAQRIVVCGRARERAQAQVKILTSAERASRGVVATQLAAYTVSSGLGLEEVRLTASAGTVKKMQISQLLDLIVKATGCVALEFHVSPKVQIGERDFRGTGEQSALVAGSRDQRWLAGQLVNVMAAGLEMRSLKQVPDHLLGECRLIKIPKECMGVILGSGRRNLHQLMQETSCVVLLTKEDKGKGKREASEMDDLLELMFDRVREGPTTELALFGAPRARLHAEVRLMVAIETKFTGFYPKPDGDDDEVDKSEGLGIDKIWFESDFEPDTTRQRSMMLSAASGCGAEAVGRLVLLCGTGADRQRGREYARWMVGRQHGKLPHVSNLNVRRDIVTLEVPRDAMKNKWLRAEMQKLSQETKTWAFFDDWEGEGPTGPGRLVLAGVEVEKGGKFVDKLLDDYKQMVDDVTTYGKPRSKYTDESWNGAWGGGDWGGWSGWSGGWQGWSWDGGEANVPPPATPGGLNGVPPPATPGVPHRGVPPPATPVPGGGNRGVPPPATPAPGGARGVPPPATPVPGRGGNVPPPATPGGLRSGVAPPATPGGFGPHGTAAPCTPAPGGFGVAPPATPGGFGPHGNSAPCTPAPGSFGPHGNRAPSTPGPGGGGGVAPPATPGGFGPHGTAAPCTPAPAGFGGVAPPATPGMPGRGVRPPETPAGFARVAAPCTPAPAGFGTGPPPPATPGGLLGGRKVPAPQTPAFPGAGEQKKSPVPAPQTPAFLGVSEEKKTRPPAPQTPAVFGASAEKKVAAPQTPACFAEAPARVLGSGPAQKRTVSAPQTPAFPGDSPAPRAGGVPPEQAPKSGKLLTFNSLKRDASKESLVEQAPELPPGWTKMTSKSNGKVYYWNAKLKQSQYEPPKA